MGVVTIQYCGRRAITRRLAIDWLVCDGEDACPCPGYRLESVHMTIKGLGTARIHNLDDYAAGATNISRLAPIVGHAETCPTRSALLIQSIVRGTITT